MRAGQVITFILIGISMLIPLFSAAHLQQAERERIRLVHADSLKSVSYEDQVVQEVWGNVYLRQGEAYLRCDLARWWKQSDRVIMLGNVKIYDGKHTLRGDSVEYDGKTHREIASGNVFFQTKKRTINTKRLTYLRDEEKVFADGDVVITDFVEHAVLKGEKALYDRSSDYGWIEGNPELVKIDTTSDQRMIVRGMRIEAWGKEQRIVISDSVKITKGDLDAESQTAVYFSENDSLILADKPVVVQQAYRMRGDTIFVNFMNLNFNRGLIKGEADISWEEDSTFVNKLNGKMITIVAHQDTIQRLIVEGQASSIYHVFDEEQIYQGVNSVKGDRIVLTFNKDRSVENVDVLSTPGLSSGVYTPKGQEEKEKEGEGEAKNKGR